MKLEILYQDEYLVAINKPSGLLVHRSEIDRHTTLFALQQLRNQLNQRVYPLHRLDKPTSGVLLFALNSDTASVMAKQWREHLVEKRYLSIVRGYILEPIYLDKALIPPVDKYAKRERIKPAQTAATDFCPLAKVELDVMVDKYPQSRYSLVECIPKTGRKHQIRRHLKHLSHPIMGDARYGKGRHSRYFRDILHAPRLLLHAWQLCFQHPYNQQLICIEAPLDTIWINLVKKFQWQNSLPNKKLIDLTPERLILRTMPVLLNDDKETIQHE
jgi:tRNA pseudouridine65 synthase